MVLRYRDHASKISKCEKVIKSDVTVAAANAAKDKVNLHKHKSVRNPGSEMWTEPRQLSGIRGVRCGQNRAARAQQHLVENGPLIGANLNYTQNVTIKCLDMVFWDLMLLLARFCPHLTPRIPDSWRGSVHISLPGFLTDLCLCAFVQLD
jgi:hypothetical protein